MNPFSSVYPTADERYVLLTITNPDREWPQLCRAVGHDEWLADPRFETMRSLFKHRESLIDMVSEVTRTLSLSALCERLDAHEITYGVIKKMSEVVEDEQLFANDILVETGSKDPSYPVTVANPLQVDGLQKRSAGPAPAIGEHSRQILTELGMDAERIAALIDQGVVGAIET